MKKLFLLLIVSFALFSCSKEEDANTCNCDQITENNYAEAELYVQGFANNYNSDTQGWVMTSTSSVNVDCSRNGEKKIIQKLVSATMPDGEKVYKINRTRISCK